MFSTSWRLSLSLGSLDQLSPHVIDYNTNILKKTALPQKPRLPSEGIEIKFYEKDFRDKFMKLLKDALAAKAWTVPFKRAPNEMIKAPVPTTTTGATSGGLGITAIKKTIES